MRVRQSIVIPTDEIRVSKIDLVARARRQIVDNIGDNLISASPALIVENEFMFYSCVELAMDVYESDDFDMRFKYLKEKLDVDSFKIVADTLSADRFGYNIKTKELTDGK